METTKSLNCSVFFNPNSRDERKKMNSKCSENIRETKSTRYSNGGELFTITYVPEEFQNMTADKIDLISPSSSRKDSKKNAGTPACKSCVEIEEFIAPNCKRQDHLKMNYILDDQVKCSTCYELKQALDYTIQKLHTVAKVKNEGEKRGETCENGCKKKVKKRCKIQKNIQNIEKYDRVDEIMTKAFINDVEEAGPLAEFFSHLIRNATISKMKNFSKDLEEKLTLIEMNTIDRKESWDDIQYTGFQNKICKKRMKSKNDNTCKSCEQLQQSMYKTVSKLYEAAGVKTDFPTVQKLETYAFLVYPNGVNYPCPSRRPNDSKSKKSLNFNARHDALRTQDTPKNFSPMFHCKRVKGKRRYEDFSEQENQRMLKHRIRKHKAAFNASKFVHILTALAVSLTTIVIISMDWVVTEPPYGLRVLGTLLLLFFGCLYNMYLIFVLGIFSFKNYFIIPCCWVALSLSNGKCADPLIPDYVCDTKIHFMSQVYLFVVFIEYYLASGIHAVLVLEINQVRKIPVKELLKYSLFNLPLLIIVSFVLSFRFLSSVTKHTKDYIKNSTNNVNL